MMFSSLINIVLKNGSTSLGVIEDFIMTEYFSQEQLAQLDKELDFTIRSIGVLTRDFNYHRAQTSHEIVCRVLDDFRIDAMKLEIKIKMLQEFMDGETE